MGTVPLGGITITNNDIGSVELFDVVYGDPDVFTPTTSDRLYPKGLLLGRLTGGTLTPFTTDDTPAGSGTFVGVLGSPAQATGLTPLNLTYIVSGQVRLGKLSIDDTSAAVVITDTIKDDMRRQGVIPLTTTELDQIDNPQS